MLALYRTSHFLCSFHNQHITVMKTTINNFRTMPNLTCLIYNPPHSLSLGIHISGFKKIIITETIMITLININGDTPRFAP